MSYTLEYIGPTQVFKAVSLHPEDSFFIDIPLNNGQQYAVELQQDGPVIVFNGERLINPNATIWVVFNFLGGKIAYSTEAIFNHWRMV